MAAVSWVVSDELWLVAPLLPRNPLLSLGE
jgi:hypothetical protein